MIKVEFERSWFENGRACAFGVFILEISRRRTEREVPFEERPRTFRLVVRPPEAMLLTMAIFLAGLVATGTPRYVILGLAWLLLVSLFSRFPLPLPVLMTAGSALVGLFGPNPEGFLAFIWLTLVGFALLLGGVIAIAGLIHFVAERQFRIPRRRARRDRRRVGGPPRPRPHGLAPIRSPRRLSLSQYIVGLAVRRLPAEMELDERERWEEEMRRDVEEGLPLLRIFYALGIWQRGAPAMLEGAHEAPTHNRRD